MARGLFRSVRTGGRAFALATLSCLAGCFAQAGAAPPPDAASEDELRFRLGVPRERVVYVGDGSSDIHVMLHVNRGDGLTIAASEARHIAQIARRTVISDDALSVLVPILEEVVKYQPAQIRQFFEQHSFVIQEWDRVRTDWVTIRPSTIPDGSPHIVAA